MPYESVDKLQKVLAEQVFHYAKDAKKASGRALGTLIEVVAFYLLKSWGLEHSLAIEKALAEYGNPEITHNVEYTLHPVWREQERTLRRANLPFTSKRVLAAIDEENFSLADFSKASSILLTADYVLRNSCTIAKSANSHLIATLAAENDNEWQVTVVEQYAKPYAMFECKRVGVEEGMKKGPQTIEKAKQGAYVAKTVSSLHKVRTAKGELLGLIYQANDSVYTKPYAELLAEIVATDEPDLLRDFVLTVGVVSNHGNWFTSDNPNKELKVLAQAYDWLIFLSDAGLSEFITELLLNPPPALQPAQTAFQASYAADKKRNRFTKVQMDYTADRALQTYFNDNLPRIESWFNVISPKGGSMRQLREQISGLREKDWRAVYAA